MKEIFFQAGVEYNNLSLVQKVKRNEKENCFDWKILSSCVLIIKLNRQKPAKTDLNSFQIVKISVK